MKIKLVPTHAIELSKYELNNRATYDDDKFKKALYLKLAPFFVGRQGEKGPTGETGTGNFLTLVEW